MTEMCGAKTRAGTPCGRAPATGRTRCRLHGGATPRGIDSPHWKHGERSVVMREHRNRLGATIRQMDRAQVADQVAFALAVWVDIDARLQLLEAAVFGQARESFELTPGPGSRVMQSINLLEWADERRRELREAERRGQLRAERRLGEHRQLEETFDPERVRSVLDVLQDATA